MKHHWCNPAPYRWQTVPTTAEIKLNARVWNSWTVFLRESQNKRGISCVSADSVRVPLTSWGHCVSTRSIDLSRWSRTDPTSSDKRYLAQSSCVCAGCSFLLRYTNVWPQTRSREHAAGSIWKTNLLPVRNKCRTLKEYPSCWDLLICVWPLTCFHFCAFIHNKSCHYPRVFTTLQSGGAEVRWGGGGGMVALCVFLKKCCYSARSSTRSLNSWKLRAIFVARLCLNNTLFAVFLAMFSWELTCNVIGGNRDETSLGALTFPGFFNYYFFIIASSSKTKKQKVSFYADDRLLHPALQFLYFYIIFLFVFKWFFLDISWMLLQLECSVNQ